MLSLLLMMILLTSFVRIRKSVKYSLTIDIDGRIHVVVFLILNSLKLVIKFTEMSKLKKFSFLFHEMFHSDMFIYNLMLFMLKFIALIFTFFKFS